MTILLVGLANGDRDEMRRAHHHAFDDRLAADAGELRRVSLETHFFFLYLFRKRSTRPSVSISLCLPVKNGWQFEQISTLMFSWSRASQ